MRPALKIPFVLSVSLNFLLLGLLASNCVKGKPPEKGALILALVEKAALSPETAPAVLEKTRAAVLEGERLTSEIEAKRSKALGTLRSEIFDATAYSAEVRHVTELRTERRQKMSEFITWLATQISPSDRARLAGLLERP